MHGSAFIKNVLLWVVVVLLWVVRGPQRGSMVTGGQSQSVERTVQPRNVSLVMLQGRYMGVARGGAMYRHSTVL